MQVVLFAVVSLDGCLTRHDEPTMESLSSAADVAHFKRAVSTCDATISGRLTYEADRSRLLESIRRTPGTKKRIVMTSRPEHFADDAMNGVLEFTNADAATVVNDLRADGRQRVALLGGSGLYNEFLAEGLVDELVITIEARVFGTGIRLAGTTTPIDPALELRRVEQIGPNTVVLTMTRVLPGMAG
jgi:riboflavin biosynthesis pyrimidine reductase